MDLVLDTMTWMSLSARTSASSRNFYSPCDSDCQGQMELLSASKTVGIDER